jgi:hypothetical protein
LAVKGKKLPHTEGFFFGASSKDKDQCDYDIGVLSKALAWVEGKPKLDPLHKPVALGSGMEMRAIDLKTFDQLTEDREVFYRASW